MEKFLQVIADYLGNIFALFLSVIVPVGVIGGLLTLIYIFFIHWWMPLF